MAALQKHFYHGTIATYTAAIGSLFNQIQIKRSNNKLIRVPLAYTSRQKFDYIQKYDDGPEHIRVRWPRMGFQLSNMQRDPTRALNKHLTLYDRTQVDNTTNSVNRQFNRVPYTFTYELFVQTKNMDDMLQIIEQIAAWFNPSLNIVINDNPDLDGETSISVQLDSSSLEDSFQGMMEDEKTLSANLSFTVEGYLYMPTSDQSLIRTVYVNYNDLDTNQFIDQNIYDEDDAL